MPRDNFEKELRLLNRELILMASECETLIAKASRVVMKGEMDLIVNIYLFYNSPLPEIVILF